MATMHSVVLLILLVLMATSINIIGTEGAISKSTMVRVWRINKVGPFLGLVVPNSFEMNPLLRSPDFVQHPKLPYLDFGGRRFHFGRIKGQKVIIVMTGLSMVKGVVHFGIAGNANSGLQIGDVTIPRHWAHTGLWNWQRYGDGPDNELPFESSGDYTRKIGYLNFSDYTAADNIHEKTPANYLNSVWYQPEEIFPVNGVPEERQHAFWLPVDENYYALAHKLEGLKLERCVNSTTCLERNPMVVSVTKGCSANAYIDNAAYRQLLRSKFDITPIDMESAAVALICTQHQTPFIVIRALSDLAGGGSSQSNEASVFSSLAAQNAVTVVTQFISVLS